MADTIWNGNGTLVSATKGAGVRVAIASIANTSPIAVTTLGAHGFNTGDTIEQEGTSGVADGQYQITKVDGTHFLLNDTTANGTSGSGYAIDYELQPAYQMPANATLADVNDVITLGEGLSNPIPYLYRRAGKWRLYNQYAILAGNIISTPIVSNPWSANANFTSSAFVALTSATFTLQSFSDLPSGPAPVVASGDMLDFALSFSVNAITSTSTQNAIYQIGLGFVQGGTLYVTTAYQSIYANYLTGGDLITPVTVTGTVFASNLGISLPTSALSICIMARQDYKSSTNAVELDLIGPLTGTLRQWRAN